MTTIRRTYAYLLGFSGLAMLAIALANLVQVLIDVLLQSPLIRADRYVRDTVSLNAAAALVGLPVWLIHWWWIQRWARADERERASTLRRLYVYAILAAATVFTTYSARDAVAHAVNALSNLPSPSFNPLLEVIRPLPFAAVGTGVWLAHWRIAGRDRDLVGEIGGSATLRRWYVNGLAFFGLVTLLIGVQGLVEALWRLATLPGQSVAVGVGPGAASALVGLGVWLVHCVVLPVRLPENSRRDDAVSVLRGVYLFLALALAVVATLFGVSQVLFYAVGRLLGVDRPGGVGGDLLAAAATPASFALVYGAAWAYQRQALRRQAAAFGEAPRQAGIRRLYTYLVALVALAVLATGVAGLLWTLGDVLFNPAAATSGEGWRGQVALYSTLAIVGLPVWLLYWQPTPGGSEPSSLARRLYVYLSLIGAMLTLIAGAAAFLYRLIGLALGESSSAGVLTDLAHALAAGIVAAVVAVYHWRVLRADTRRTLPVSQPTVPEAQALVELRAVNAEALERALSALRSTGVQVIVR